MLRRSLALTDSAYNTQPKRRRTPSSRGPRPRHRTNNELNGDAASSAPGRLRLVSSGSNKSKRAKTTVRGKHPRWFLSQTKQRNLSVTKPGETTASTQRFFCFHLSKENGPDLTCFGVRTCSPLCILPQTGSDRNVFHVPPQVDTQWYPWQRSVTLPAD